MARPRSTLPGRSAAGGVPLLGSTLESIDQAEERTRFSALLDRLGIPQPEGGMAHSVEEALTLAERIGYPVIVRPSFVIGGLAIDFCYSPTDLARQLAAATVVDPDRPVRIDRYLEGIEVDVDAVSDGERVLIPGLLEHVERAGVHSGDSVGIFPPQTVSDGDQALIVATMERIVLALGARGLVNAQFIVRDDGVYLIEVNPRASRTVPFLSKVTGVPMVELAVRISLGASLPELGWDGGHLPPPAFVAVKAPAFSTAKLRGVDPSVGPGMQSTGEVIGIHTDPRVALAKALLGAALVPPRPGADGALALLSIADRDKGTLGRLAAALAGAGYRMAATPGTRAALADAGYEARPVAKLGEAADEAAGEVPILDLIASGEVRLGFENAPFSDRILLFSGGLSDYPAFGGWLVLNSTCLWVGILVYILTLSSCGKVLRSNEIKKALLLTPIVFAAVFGAWFALCMLDWTFPFATQTLATTPWGQIADLRLLADVMRVPYFIALVSVLWNAIPQSKRRSQLLPVGPLQAESSTQSDAFALGSTLDPFTVLRSFGFMAGAGLINAMIAGILLCRLPDLHSPTLSSLLVRSILHVVIGVIAGVGGCWLYWKNPSSPFANSLPFHSRSLLSFVLPGGSGLHPWWYFRSSYQPQQLSLPLSVRSFLQSGFALPLPPSMLRRRPILPGTNQRMPSCFLQCLYSAPWEAKGSPGMTIKVPRP